MAIGYLEVGQKVWINGVGYTIEGIQENEQVRLRTIHTRRNEFTTLLALKRLYVDGGLTFVSSPLSSANDLDRELSEKYALDLSGLSDEAYEETIRRHSYVMEVINASLKTFTKSTLDPVIRETWVKNGKKGNKPHWVSVWRWIKRYDAAGQDVRGLVTRNSRKGNSKRKVCEKLVEIVSEAVSTIYMTDVGSTIRDVVERAIVLVKRVNVSLPKNSQLPLPSRALVNYQIKQIPAFELMVARKGRRAAIKAFRTSKDVVVAERVLEKVEIDHTIMDIMLVHDVTLMPLGRPTLTVCIDVASRCVLGIYVGFEPPSFSTVAHCLRESFLPKIDLKEKYSSIEGEWEAYGVPENLVVDNGLEFYSRGLESLCYAFNVIIHYTPRKTPWFKAKVERFIGTLNRNVAHGVPGTTFSSFFEKEDYDAVKNAVIRQSDFEEMVRLWVVDYYHKSPHRSLGRTPSSVWNELVVDTPIPLASDVEDLDYLCAVPSKEKRVVTHKGVQINNLFYNSDDLGEMRMRFGETFKAEVRFVPSDLSYVFVVAPDLNKPVKVEAVDKKYAEGLTLWAHKLCAKYAKAKLNRKDIEALAEVKEKMRRMAEDALGNKRLRTRKTANRFLENTEVACVLDSDMGSELALEQAVGLGAAESFLIDGHINKKTLKVKR